jgi:hypothetical protein
MKFDCINLKNYVFIITLEHTLKSGIILKLVF